MSLKIVVLAKQVPDTRNVGKDAMTPEGTVNRAVLPAIVNPDDLNALELALRLKEDHPGSSITMITMGLPKASDVLREGLYRGVDRGVLVTDRAMAGADSLATSYVLSQAIRKLGIPDIIVCGRQAIDGDTAQVGPQVAEKLQINQITYVEEVLSVSPKEIIVTRRIDGGVEKVKAPFPLLLTVTGSAASCRPRNAKLVMKYKRALAPSEMQANDLPYAEEYKKKPYLSLTQWGVSEVEADLAQCGLNGSPTKVKSVQNIVFKAKESKRIGSSDAEVRNLIVELLESHTIG